MDILKKIALPTRELPALPVWQNPEPQADEYADFFPQIDFLAGHSYRLRIACDTDYNIFLGETLVGFGQFADWDGRLIWDEYPLAPQPGDRLRLTVWHEGTDSQTHIKREAYAAFAVFDGEECVCASGPDTPSRLCPGYVQHLGQRITGQLGLGYSCTAAVPAEPCGPSAVRTLCFDAVLPRPNRRLTLGAPLSCSVCAHGAYRLRGTADAAARMTEADLLPTREEDVAARMTEADLLPAREEDVAARMTEADLLPPQEDADGLYWIFDAGEETVGFPELRFTADREVTADFGWGEHLKDGICRTAIGSRRFTSEYTAKAGQNRFFPALRRLGGRYFQIFIPGKATEVSLRFHPVLYPAKVLPSSLTGLRRRIRDTAVHTLRCCLHEHYEDCPWREQALYTLDSRNQMLAGYRVFEGGNREAARASLDLISRGVRPDGLLTLCYPAGLDYPIPFYTLACFIQFREYLEYSGDVAFVAEKLPVLRRLMRTVLERRLTDGPCAGLCPRYPESEHIWNFYEWSPGMDGHGGGNRPDGCDAPFNAFLVLALRAYAAVCSLCGSEAEARQADADARAVCDALRRAFLRPDGCFDTFSDRRDAPVAVLTQALCLLAGAGGEKKELPLELIRQNGGSGSVPATLSMACWRYDALLHADRDKYAGDILREIDRDYGYMLSEGATTFWETLRGEADFSRAGSLCHGWSAMAAYYYGILL